MQRRLAEVPYTKDFESPYAPGNSGQISADGHSALLRFEIAGDDTEAKDRVGAALEATSARRRRPIRTSRSSSSATPASTSRSTTSISDDFKQALVTSLPITLVILLIAFGALVAAGVPLLLALTAVLATIGLIGPISHISPVDSSINEVILLIGLAVGVDYSMFYLRREREERESGRSEEASLAAAAATSGRAVLISGFTVMIAMAGMYLGGRADLPVVRHRHDHRRRGGGGGVADRAARDCWPGSATGSRRAASRSSRTSRGTPARAASGRGS